MASQRLPWSAAGARAAFGFMFKRWVKTGGQFRRDAAIVSTNSAGIDQHHQERLMTPNASGGGDAGGGGQLGLFG
jgi:hypothetical protein